MEGMKEILLDPLQNQARREREHLRLHLVVIPAMRLLGMGLLCVLGLLHSLFLSGGTGLRAMAWLIAVSLFYCLLTTLILRQFYRPGRSWLPALMFHLDLLVYLAFLHLSGGPQSLFFLVLVTRGADLYLSSLRAALYYLCATSLLFVGYLFVLQAGGQGVLWSEQLLKLALLWAVAAYLIAGSVPGRQLRVKLRHSMRLAKELVLELSQQKEELQRRGKALDEALQKAERLARVKSEFLAHMSHEIRTPIHGILGMNQLLLEGQLEVRQREACQAIQSSAEMLSRVVSDILDLSRMESGQTQLEARPFDLQGLLEEVVAYFEWDARKKGVDLWLDADARLPVELLGDPQRLKQVLLNLVGNGLKFTEEGQVVLECRPLVPSSQGYRSDRLGWADVFQTGSQVSMPVGDGRLALFFAVHDTGIGVAEEKKSVIFTSFAQGDSSSSRKYGGTGLGLTLARKLIDLMGGVLDLQSRTNQGSSFFFTLSLQLSRKPQNHPHPAPPTGLGWMGPPEIQPRLGSLLEQAGYVISHPAKEGLRGILCWAGRAHYRGILPCITLVANHMHYEGAVGVACLRMPFTARRLRAALAGLGKAGSAPAGSALAGSAPAGSAHARSLAGPAAPGPERARLKLLLAEDNPISQKLLLRLLAERGVLAEAVSTGAAVLEAVGGRAWDAILMDIQMPEMDGLEATRRLRELGFSAEELPIIAVTAHDLPEERRRCERAGMTGFLVKPIRLEELDALLESLLRGESVNPGSAEAAIEDGPGEE